MQQLSAGGCDRKPQRAKGESGRLYHLGSAMVNVTSCKYIFYYDHVPFLTQRAAEQDHRDPDKQHFYSFQHSYILFHQIFIMLFL